MPPQLYVSPTEPKTIQKLGTVSLLPERHGVDIMWLAQGARWGVQRKEITDLIASRSDGRLAIELGQMRMIEYPMLLVEGRLNWTSEGELIAHFATLSRRQFQGMLWSVQHRGVWVERTDSIEHTYETIRWLCDWSMKERHSGLAGRPAPRGNWGYVSDREWGVHLLTSFQGIGIGTAEAIYDHFGGVPMSWDVDAKGLMEVKGIGKKRAETLIAALQADDKGNNKKKGAA